MGIAYEHDLAVVDGSVGVEETEALMQWLAERPAAAVDLARAGHLHSAALQVLLALRPRIAAAPAERWLAATLCA